MILLVIDLLLAAALSVLLFATPKVIHEAAASPEPDYTRIGEALHRITLNGEATVTDGMLSLTLVNGESSGVAVSAEVTLSGEIAPLLTTGLIDPGWRLESIRLDRIPDPGTHQSLVRLKMYDPETNLWLGDAMRQMLIHVTR